MKPGQFFITGFYGHEPPSYIIELIKKYDLFGIILFSRNFKSEEQLKSLCFEFQQIKKQHSPYPLIISTDYEGGFVTRFNLKNTFLPSPICLRNNHSLLDNIISYHAQKLHNCGFHLNFSPVLDAVHENSCSPLSLRSIGSKNNLISKTGAKIIDAQYKQNIFSCAKHFPGIGKSNSDSHFEFPQIDLKLEELSRDISPFESAIDHQIQFIMTSHAYVNAFDKNHPATFSKTINEDILRLKLKYKKLIITDDLCMESIQKKFKTQYVVEQAIKSTVDLMLICHQSESKLKNTFSDFEHAFYNHSMKNLIDQSIQRKKNFFNQLSSLPLPQKLNIAATEMYENTLKECRKFIKTNVKSPAFKKDNLLLITPKNFTFTFVEDTQLNNYFMNELNKLFEKIHITCMNDLKNFDDSWNTMIIIKENQDLLELKQLKNNSFDFIINIKYEAFYPQLINHSVITIHSNGFDIIHQSILVDEIKKNFK